MVLDGNRKEFDICGISKWHQLGIKGKGRAIGEIEPVRADLSCWDGKMYDPFNVGVNAEVNGHGHQVMNIMKQVAPEADLYTLPGISGIFSSTTASGQFVDEILPFAAEHIDVIGASLKHSGTLSLALQQRIKTIQDNTIFVCAAGNDSTYDFNGYAQDNTWISVAAVNYIESMNKIERASYSSVGEELDFSMFTNLFVENVRYPENPFQQNGTSIAQPMLSGMVLLVQQYFFDNTGRKLSQQQMYQFIKDHVKDLGQAGFDAYYGHGLFVLPEPSTIDVNKYLGTVETPPPTPPTPPSAKEMTLYEAVDVWAAAGVILDPEGMKKDYDAGQLRPDRFFYFLTKSAKHLLSLSPSK